MGCRALSTNKKSHISFRLVPNRKRCAFRGSGASCCCFVWRWRTPLSLPINPPLTTPQGLCMFSSFLFSHFYLSFLPFPFISILFPSLFFLFLLFPFVSHSSFYSPFHRYREAAVEIQLVGLWVGIAIPDFFSNPGISGLKNANPGMPGLNPGIESRFELVKISSNSLVLVSWWVLESWSICWSPVLWIIVNIFTFLVSCRMIQFHHYLM